MFSRFKTFDIWLLLLPLFLAVVGSVVIYSITIQTVGSLLATKQVIYLILGFILYFVFALLDYRSLKSWASAIYLVSVGSLLLVPFLGKTVFGAQRWIDLGFFQFQPSELAKLALIMVLALLFTDKVGKVHVRRLVASLIIVLIPTFLILAQPDLGSAITVVLLGLGIIMHTGLSGKQWWGMALGLILIIMVAMLAWFQVGAFSGLIKDYQRERVMTFINPEADPAGAGYNILQATIAIGSGGVLGQGLGFGSQSQLNFLPVAHADFIFAAIAESWGFAGSAIILLVYVALVLRILATASLARDDFSMLFCVGVAVLLLVQLVINVGMNLQLMPVTGLTLPLVSSGGSSIIVVLMSLGIVQSIFIRNSLYK